MEMYRAQNALFSSLLNMCHLSLCFHANGVKCKEDRRQSMKGKLHPEKEEKKSLSSKPVLKTEM